VLQGLKEYWFCAFGSTGMQAECIQGCSIEVLALQGQQDWWFSYGSWIADFQGHSIEDVVLSGLQIEGLVSVGLQC
jgi:hypothetical protein